MSLGRAGVKRRQVWENPKSDSPLGALPSEQAGSRRPGPAVRVGWESLAQLARAAIRLRGEDEAVFLASHENMPSPTRLQIWRQLI
jgi:hypothetical protein